MEKYSYIDHTLTVSNSIEDPERVFSQIKQNLNEYSDGRKILDEKDILEEERLEIPDECFKGEIILEPEEKYIADEAAVYTFRRPSGIDLTGNKAMIDINLPREFPSIY